MDRREPSHNLTDVPVFGLKLPPLRPQISCGFTSDVELGQFWNSSIPGPVVEARGNFTDQGDLDAFFGGLNETDAKLVQFGQKCSDSDGAFLKYMGAVRHTDIYLSDLTYVVDIGGRCARHGLSLRLPRRPRETD
jgi:hypothetical protein